MLARATPGPSQGLAAHQGEKKAAFVAGQWQVGQELGKGVFVCLSVFISHTLNLLLTAMLGHVLISLLLFI